MTIGVIALICLTVTSYSSAQAQPLIRHDRHEMPIFEARDPKNPSEPLIPYDHQDDFGWSGSRISYLAGAWRAAKSYGLLKHAEVSMNFNPGCKGGIIEPDYKMLEEFLENKFIPAFRPYILGYKKTHFLYRIYMKRGITVYGLSGHNLDKLEQWEFAWMEADEVRLMGSELLIRANTRCNDSNAGVQRVGFAGLPEYGWLSKEFAGRNDEQRRIIHCSIEDNPSLTREFKDSQYANCPAHMKACYLDGQFVPPGGSVHPGFGEWNFIDWRHNRNFETKCVIDWSPRVPAVLFYQVLTPGTTIQWMDKDLKLNRKSIVFFDEMHPGGPDKVITTPQLCAQIKAHNYPLSKFVCDPAGKAVEATSGTSNLRLARQHLGIGYQIPPKNLASKLARIEHVNLALEPLTGHPTLFVARSLEKAFDPRALVPSFRAYSYPKDKEGKPLDENPYEDGITEHAMDDVQYVVSVEIPAFPRTIRKPPRSYL